jgi:SNF2 family DNA or RNA helicase
MAETYTGGMVENTEGCEITLSKELGKMAAHQLQTRATNTLVADSYKYEISIMFDTLNGLSGLPSLPKDLENSKVRKVTIQPFGPYDKSQQIFADWNLCIDGQQYYFSNNFHGSRSSFRRGNMAEVLNWKEMATQNPDYMLLTLSKLESDDGFLDDSNAHANQISHQNTYIPPTKPEEYKLTFRPNLGLAKKLYLENQNIPVKLIQVIYMFLRRDNSQIVLRDSESELMSPNPRGFKIQLYDYQAKTLTWMRQIESGDIKIKYYKDYYHGIPDPDTNEPFCYVSSKDVEETAKTLAHYHIYQDPPDFFKEFKINGGLLGDIMGNGKTVTGIGHVFSEHCRLGPSYPPLDKGIEEDAYIPSRATLVLCPNNIIDQWYNEFVKCLGTMVIGNTNARKGQIYASALSDNSGRNYRVIRIATMHHLNNLSHADIINADAIIVTYSMMTNTNHIGKGFTKENGFSEQLVEQRLAKASIPELGSDDPETWSNQVYDDLEHILPRKLLYFYKWNRVIHDEFHEVIATKTRTNSLLFIIKSLLKARYYWGFSGSSILENDNILMNLPYLLHFEDDWSEALPMTGVNKSLFFDKCVIKNTKRILPPLKYVKVPVPASEEEKMLYKAMAVISDVEQQVRFACYHNLNVSSNTTSTGTITGRLTVPTVPAAGTVGTVGTSIAPSISNKLLSADEIMAQQHEDRAYRLKSLAGHIKVMEDIINDIITNLKSLQALTDYPFTKNWQTVQDLFFLTDSGHKDHNAKVKAGLEVDPHLRRARDLVREYKKEMKALESAKQDVKALEESNRLYLNFLENKTLTCSLCDFTSAECNKFLALDCKDYFCLECTELMISSNQKTCPKCRNIPFDINKLANLGSKNDVDAEVRSQTGLSKRLWGSKICDIVDKIAEVILSDPTNKVILFAQWEDLLEQFEVALSEVKIESCTVKGATSMRTKAIRTFQERKNCKVILLSSVYGASGINLVEANYVFIVHPFLGDMNEQYEYQAICRAYRTGQKRTVTVMHFIREDTYEQVLYSKRDHKDEVGSIGPTSLGNPDTSLGNPEVPRRSGPTSLGNPEVPRRSGPTSLGNPDVPRRKGPEQEVNTVRPTIKLRIKPIIKPSPTPVLTPVVDTASITGSARPVIKPMKLLTPPPILKPKILGKPMTTTDNFLSASNTVIDSVTDSVRDLVTDSVTNSVRDSIRDSMRDSGTEESIPITIISKPAPDINPPRIIKIPKMLPGLVKPRTILTK